MKYCCTDIHGGCYIEFQVGDFSSHNSFWLSDSLFLSEDTFNKFEIGKLFLQVIPEFNYYGPTTVSKAQWKKITNSGCNLSHECQSILHEIDTWAKQCFQTEDCFSVLGI